MWFWLDGIESWCVGVEGSSQSICVRRFSPDQLSPFFASIFPLFPQKRLILRLITYSSHKTWLGTGFLEKGIGLVTLINECTTITLSTQIHWPVMHIDTRDRCCKSWIQLSTLLTVAYFILGQRRIQHKSCSCCHNNTKVWKSYSTSFLNINCYNVACN